jgi:hypothetical protein
MRKIPLGTVSGLSILPINSSLLSMARLNKARSGVRPSTSSRVPIDQTCFGRSGGWAPTSLPLFRGVRGAEWRIGNFGRALSFPSVTAENDHAPRPRGRNRFGFQRVAVMAAASGDSRSVAFDPYLKTARARDRLE